MGEQEAIKVAESFDHMSPQFARDPWTPMRQLRDQCPVARSTAKGGFWVVSSYAAIGEVARDDETWTSAEGILIEGPQPIRNIPIETDPPEFNKYRRFLNPLFSPSAINRREPEVRALANELIDGFIEDGHCDIHRALAQPLPAIMTYRLLGLPEEGAQEFIKQFEESTSGVLARREGQTDDPGSGLLAHFDTVIRTIADRRAEPREDIISYLVQNEIDGEKLDDTELLGFIALILAGGLLTTTDAIGNALVQLERQPEDRQRLSNDPQLMHSAIEEFLRFEAPVMALARTATRDTQLEGQRIAKGDRVLLLWASANRDSSVFDDADRCILDRQHNRHMAFGVGIHRCLGSHLGRLEFRVALEEILRRMPDHHIELDSVVMAPIVGVTYGRIRIPMSFTPGRREG